MTKKDPNVVRSDERGKIGRTWYDPISNIGGKKKSADVVLRGRRKPGKVGRKIGESWEQSGDESTCSYWLCHDIGIVL